MPTFATFKDLSVTFTKHPVSADLVQVKDKAAVVQSISNLLLTNKGERPFQPELGCDLRNMLFEPLDYATSAQIKSVVAEVINKYEPRVKVVNIYCFPDYDNNGYEVELSYTLVGRDDNAITVDFFLERTR